MLTNDSAAFLFIVWDSEFHNAVLIRILASTSTENPSFSLFQSVCLDLFARTFFFPLVTFFHHSKRERLLWMIWFVDWFYDFNLDCSCSSITLCYVGGLCWLICIEVLQSPLPRHFCTDPKERSLSWRYRNSPSDHHQIHTFHTILVTIGILMK